VNSGQVNSGPPKVDLTKKIFDPTRDTAKDIADAIKQATKEKKRILLDVGGNWCIWCRRLDLLMETDKQIRDALKQKFVVVKVNFSPENKNESILSKYPAVTGYPHLFVLEKDGKLLHSQDTGLLETGDHHDPAKVMEFLNKWSGK
jgi:thioredoxin-related protein